MRAKKFTNEEDNYIRAHYRKYSLNDIAVALNRSKSGIQGRVNALGLRDTSPEARMSFEQIKETTNLSDRDGDTLKRLIELRDLLHQTMFGPDIPATAIPRLASEYRNTLSAIHDLTETESEGGESKLEALFAELEDAR
ncbi:hypothetical protein [Eubacterium sp.]|uniref:hypothetical protein n=1 Tax=Eubacterium sp. TaxID=142586 RepID=UPI002FCB6F99